MAWRYMSDLFTKSAVLFFKTLLKSRDNKMDGISQTAQFGAKLLGYIYVYIYICKSKVGDRNRG